MYQLSVQRSIKRYSHRKHSKPLVRGLLIIFFILSFSVLKYFPGMMISFEIWIALVTAYLVIIFPFKALVKRTPVNKLELYALLLIMVIPIMSASMAYIEFGQPILYGLLTARHLILVGSIFIFLTFYRAKSFNLADVTYVLLWLFWVNTTANLAISLALDPHQYTQYVGFAGGVEGEAKFTLPIDFIVFGFFYFSFDAYLERNKRSGILAVTILALLVFFGGRASLVAVCASVVWFIWRWSSLGRAAFNSGKLLLIFTTFTLCFYFVMPEKTDQLFAKFSDAFSVAMFGAEVEDISANVRNMQVAIATPFIEKNWLLGNGALSTQWNDGYKGMHGYFHPSDIGIYGILYLYGIVGFIIFFIQFILAIYYANRIPKTMKEHGNLVNALKGYLLFVALYSITTAKFAMAPEVSMLAITIIYCAYREHLARQKLTLQPKQYEQNYSCTSKL